MLKKVIAVCGPTASGKTALAIEIAKRFDGEIVSCDSMQIYKYMDIGTAKATSDEQRAVKHHMIDFLEPKVKYSVADFAVRARDCIDDIITRGKTPILAGGTGLYLDSILNNIAFDDFGSDPKFREEMELLAEKEGNDAVHKLLLEKDSQAAQKIHPNNLRRVIRALEVCHLTNKTFTEVNKESRREAVYDALIFAIDADREILYNRINERVDRMMKEGLVDEVKRLCDMGIDRNTTAMQAIGYKEVLEYLEGKLNIDEMTELIKQESRRYAKRQLTWFRRNEKINWVRPNENDGMKKIFEKCSEFLD